jgi:hypothetical protein
MLLLATETRKRWWTCPRTVQYRSTTVVLQYCTPVHGVLENLVANDTMSGALDKCALRLYWGGGGGAVSKASAHEMAQASHSQVEVRRCDSSTPVCIACMYV